MSAFMVESKSIQTIVTFLAKQARYRNGILVFLSDHGLLPKHGDQFEAATDLYNKMIDMNAQAIKARYGSVGRKSRAKFQWREKEADNVFQVLKSLNCYLYQCLEGDVPEMKLFKDLSDFRDDFSGTIVSNLPEYREAEWR